MNWKIVKETLTSEIINVSADSLWSICREFDELKIYAETGEVSEVKKKQIEKLVSKGKIYEEEKS